MPTKMKAFIGITATVVILIVLFSSNGGFRAARAVEEETARKNECAALEKADIAGK